MEVMCTKTFGFKGVKLGRSKVVFGKIRILRAGPRKIDLEYLGGEFEPFVDEGNVIKKWLAKSLIKEPEPFAMKFSSMWSTCILSLIIWKDLKIDITPSQLTYMMIKDYRMEITPQSFSTYVYAKLVPELEQRYEYNHEFSGGYDAFKIKQEKAQLEQPQLSPKE